MLVTLRQLRYFKALVECGTFSGAAEKVCISQPAVSVQIRELEATLGGPLIERESRGVALTHLGREAYEQTLRILDETSVLESLGKRSEDGPVRISVGILSTLAPYLLPGIMDRLEALSPPIEIAVVEAPGETLVTELLASRLDAAIVSLPLGMTELTEQELFEDRFLLAGRADKLASICRTFGDKVAPADLARADVGPLLTLGQDDCLAGQVMGACLTWRVRKVRRGAGSLATLSRLVARGAGLALLPETAAVCESSASPDLRFLRFSASEPSRRIGLACRTALQGQRWVGILADAAKEAGEALVAETAAAIPAAPKRLLEATDSLDIAA